MNQKLVGSGRPMEILLVEDNLEDARATLSSLKHGQVRCRVSLVCDGEEAMQFLRQEHPFASVPLPDLILLDIELPKKDGRQVLAEIRAHRGLQQIPVVVLTASLVHKAVFEARNLQVDDYLTKPVQSEEFVRVVKSLRRIWLAGMVAAIDTGQGEVAASALLQVESR